MPPAPTFAAYYRHLRALAREPLPDRPAAVLAVARKVAADFPQADLWDQLQGALEQATRSFQAGDGQFIPYFALVLRQRFRKAAAAEWARAARTMELGPGVDVAAPADDDDPGPAFRRWALRLAREAAGLLGMEAWAVLAGRLEGRSDADLARQLCVTPEYLNRRYGGEKLPRLVRRAVRDTVADLPADRRAMLVRHLSEEAGLSPAEVRALLATDDLPSPHAGRLLDEAALLETLGWNA